MMKILSLLLILANAAWGHYLAANQVRVVELESARNPAWSPDGQRLAFSAYAGELRQIFILEVGTGEVIQVTSLNRSCEHPTWSPDASRIAFRVSIGGINYSELMSIQADGTAPRQLTVAISSGSHDFQPAWSPTGEKIAFHTSRFGTTCLAVLDVGSGDIKQVAGGFTGTKDPAWSPDGERLIAWAEGFFDGGRLYQFDLSSDEPPTVLMHDPGGFRDPSWIENGNSVLYRTLRSSMNRLFIQNLDRLEPREIGLVTMDRIQPALSPDGSTLAFVGQNPGNEGIWLAEFSAIPSSVQSSTWATVKRGR